MSSTITVDREVIACLVDWINTHLDLGYWLEHGAEEQDCPETLELARQVDQILTTRSWEGA